MTAPVRVHIRVPGTAPMPELMRLIQSIESAGFDGAGILDSQMISRDTFVTLGQAATHTSRMQLFPAVTNPFTRHASVLAGAIQTVEELAPGRVKFVMGTGYTSATTIGRKAATLAEMRESIATIKTLLAGESARCTMPRLLPTSSSTPSATSPATSMALGPEAAISTGMRRPPA